MKQKERERTEFNLNKRRWHTRETWNDTEKEIHHSRNKKRKRYQLKWSLQMRHQINYLPPRKKMWSYHLRLKIKNCVYVLFWILSLSFSPSNLIHSSVTLYDFFSAARYILFWSSWLEKKELVSRAAENVVEKWSGTPEKVKRRWREKEQKKTREIKFLILLFNVFYFLFHHSDSNFPLSDFFLYSANLSSSGEVSALYKLSTLMENLHSLVLLQTCA